MRVRTDEGLPLAGGARVAGELSVGLQAQLAAEGRHYLALVAAVPGEERALELGLDEELSVEQLGSRVERRAGDGRVDVVGRSNRVPTSRASVWVHLGRRACMCADVRREESNDLGRGELARILEACKDLRNVVEWLGYRQVGRGLDRVLATDEDVQTGRARAVADTDRASELDAAPGCQSYVVLFHQRKW